eukprot:PhM_4_TR573/c0_g1_i1/m.73308
MSRKGQLCLREIIVTYGYLNERCDMRMALAREIPDFKREYPSVKISVRPRSTPEATLTGVYNDGSHLVLNCRHGSSQQILNKLHQLVGTANDEVKYFGRDSLYRGRTSVQGTWNPWLWMTDYRAARDPPPKWDRSLTEEEWSHYVKKYSAHWAAEEGAIRDGVAQYSELPQQYTDEVQQRWDEHVKPHLQSDMESKLEVMKKDAKKGNRPKPTTYDEYMLFSQPDLRTMGNDALFMMRKKQAAELVKWWDKRRDQLKEPAPV